MNIARHLGEFIPPGCTTPRRRRNGLLAAWVVSAFVGLVTSQNAGAACFVTSSGTVDCKADTITTNTTNLNGTRLRSSDRKQLFDSGVAINGSVHSGVIVRGSGLELREGATTPLPIVMENAGAVTAAHAKAVNTLRLDGNGGPISYLGSGSITNGAKRGAALFVDNTSGKVSIATGAGVISGATGINASTTGTGALTIRTGSAAVAGSADNAISASTVNGPLSVKVGSGDVTTRADSGAINLTSNNGGFFLSRRPEQSPETFPAKSRAVSRADSARLRPAAAISL